MIKGVMGCVILSEEMAALFVKHNIILLSVQAGDAREPTLIVNFKASRMFEAVAFKKEIKDTGFVDFVDMCFASGALV